jgi:hypothetical protein
MPYTLIRNSWRVRWYDSCGHPSRIHRTLDGVTTICGHPFTANIAQGHWKLAPSWGRLAYPGEGKKPKSRRSICHICYDGGVPNHYSPFEERLHG